MKHAVANCSLCCELKPRFTRGTISSMIISTQSYERLSVDFKGPLPSVSRNHYFLMVIDEYSRFPFIFSCANTSTEMVIKHLTILFGIFGFPAVIHSDNAKCFASKDLKQFLYDRGIAITHSSVYNSRGNSQCERYNGVIRNAIKLALRNRNLPLSHWETVVSEVSHSQRSLLCTTTNETPYNRFLKFSRHTMCGVSLPTWLMQEPDSVYVKQHVRNKYDPLVDEVQLVQVNPNHRMVQYPGGLENVVSIRDIAPIGIKMMPSDLAQPIEQVQNEQRVSSDSETFDASSSSDRNESDPYPEPQNVVELAFYSQ